jgi:hypothetical protein
MSAVTGRRRPVAALLIEFAVFLGELMILLLPPVEFGTLVLQMRSDCPTDAHETAESFVMRRLSQADTEQHLEHLSKCEMCQRIQQDTSAFVTAIRNAAKNLEKSYQRNPRRLARGTMARAASGK